VIPVPIFRVRITAEHFTTNESVLASWQRAEDGWAIEALDPNDRPDGVRLVKEYTGIEAEDVKEAMDLAFEQLYDEALASGVSGPNRLTVTAELQPAPRPIPVD
jgi:hypothetical protein